MSVLFKKYRLARGEKFEDFLGKLGEILTRINKYFQETYILFTNDLEVKFQLI
jgi:hypothetical protein